MRLFTVPSLSPSQKNALASLVSRCQDAEGLSISFPFEEGSLFLFLEEKNNVWAAMAFTPLWEDAFECAAFTDPSRRREGLFSRLLKAGLSALPGECDLYFSIDGHSPAASYVLDSLGAELDSQETFMELLPENFKDCGREFPEEVSETSDLSDEASTLFYRSAHGKVSIAVYPSRFYLYGLEIAAERRGEGLGTAFLSHVLKRLFSREEKPVLLQVSAENRPALALYEKTGFRVTETLSSYLY